MIHYSIIRTYKFFSAPGVHSPDPMTTPSTDPIHFTPKEYNDAWRRADLEKNYRDLCKEYTFLSVQLVRATRPFGRERTIHNLLNARLKLEHQLKRLKETYLKSQAKSQRDLEELRNELPADEANHEIEAELRKELQSSKDTLEDVLYGINQSQDSTIPSDSSGTMRLMKDTVQLRIEKIDLLKRLADLDKEKRRAEKLREDMELENVKLHAKLDGYGNGRR